MGKTDPSPQVAIVVVSFNTRELLLKCLATAVASARDTPIELMVVDNASTDGSAEAVSETYPHAHLIRNSKNLGFGAACNQAIQQSRSPLILLLNSDAQLTPEAFRSLCDCMASEASCGAAGCGIVDLHNLEITNTRFFLTPLNQVIEQAGFPAGWNLRWLNRTYRPRAGDSGIDCGVDWIEGSCLMLRREALLEVGLFDQQFFMYSEEEDLCRRLKDKGWSVCYCAGAKILHLGGASSRKNREEMLVQFYASQIKFLRKHRGPFAASLFAAAMMALLTVKLLFYEASANSPLAEEFERRLRAIKRARSINSSS